MSDPEKVGAAGQAWRIPYTDHYQFGVGDHQWFLHIPAAHPHWPRYMLSCIHLRPVEGQPPAKLQYPGATHEVMLVALNPEHNPNPDNRQSWQILTPVNAAVQFTSASDDDAAVLLDLVAQALVDGILPAEPSDFIGGSDYWITTVRRTAAHRTGGPEHE